MLGINDALVKDVHLRRAMYYGVNRKLIAEKLLYGYADEAGGTVPAGANGYVPPFVADTLYNPKLAQDELAKSGYKGEAIELLVHELAGSEQIGQLFQDQMKALGINVKLTKLDFNSAIGRMIKGDPPMFSMFLDYVFSSPEPILINIFSSAKRPGCLRDGKTCLLTEPGCAAACGTVPSIICVIISGRFLGTRVKRAKRDRRLLLRMILLKPQSLAWKHSVRFGSLWTSWIRTIRNL